MIVADMPVRKQYIQGTAVGEIDVAFEHGVISTDGKIIAIGNANHDAGISDFPGPDPVAVSFAGIRVFRRQRGDSHAIAYGGAVRIDVSQPFIVSVAPERRVFQLIIGSPGFVFVGHIDRRPARTEGRGVIVAVPFIIVVPRKHSGSSAFLEHGIGIVEAEEHVPPGGEGPGD